MQANEKFAPDRFDKVNLLGFHTTVNLSSFDTAYLSGFVRRQHARFSTTLWARDDRYRLVSDPQDFVRFDRDFDFAPEHENLFKKLLLLVFRLPRPADESPQADISVTKHSLALKRLAACCTITLSRRQRIV